jgi:predicted transcriptional regulator
MCEIQGIDDLYQKLLAGLREIQNGETVSEEEMMKKLDAMIADTP